ncbi:MAG: bifunctional folylpolyglutamate synthase/dihydrofolate synthase [Ruminococcus sp.]|nr:bifunctional folylpolyglutamate synthase/dihydrofolate synthase [Ruminococcus sp.]
MCTEWQRFLDSFSRLGKRAVGLERIRALLDALGSVQERLRFIHVTGTNGKGSICEMLSEVFIRSGCKTGLFTSPYIIEYNDRIRINGENIPDDELERLMPKIKSAVKKSGYENDFSQFEITQALAFCYFAEQECDVVILEAGLGGLLDSTNVIDNNICSVIGSVALDHMAVLGDSLEEIAFQKAGIIKSGCPCVLSPGNDPKVIEVFKKAAEEKGSRLYIPDMRRVKMTGEGNEFYFDGFEEYKGEYRPKMTGTHQVRNALSVIYACSIAGVSASAVREGIERAFIPGRTQILSGEPLIILDGGHNPDAGRALSEVLRSHGGGFTAVIGMSGDKNIGEYLSVIAPWVERVICVDDFSERALDREKLCELVMQTGKKAEVCGSVDEALDIVRAAGKAVICGSLFLVSDVLKKVDTTGIA